MHVGFHVMLERQKYNTKYGRFTLLVVTKIAQSDARWRRFTVYNDVKTIPKTLDIFLMSTEVTTICAMRNSGMPTGVA